MPADWAPANAIIPLLSWQDVGLLNSRRCARPTASGRERRFALVRAWIEADHLVCSRLANASRAGGPPCSLSAT